jgi:hypothetical protein
MTKMYNVRNLTLFFPENFGDEVTRIYYIGLKGEWTEVSELNCNNYLKRLSFLF